MQNFRSDPMLNVPVLTLTDMHTHALRLSLFDIHT